MQSLRIIRFARNYAIIVAPCLMFTLLVGALLLPVSSNTATTQPAKASTGVEAAANAETAKVLSIAQEDADKPHLMAASYYSLQGNMKATLTLNNKGSGPLEVRPTLFSIAGERLDVPPVTVDATSFRVVDLSDLVAGASPAFQQGSIELFYRGMELMLGAQVKLVESDHSLIFDEQLVEPAAMFASSRLEGVWWLPSRRNEMSLVLSNTTDAPLTVNTVVDGAAAKQKVPATFALTPHETRIVDLQQDIIGNSGGVLMQVGGISIEHSGPKGALLARGMIKDASSGYSAAVQFTDPQNAKSSKLHGAGLRLGTVAGERLSPVIVARNIGDAPSVLTGQVSYTDGSGGAGNVKIAGVHLQPGEARIVHTPALSRDVASAGLEFEYSTAPGTVIMSAISVSRDGDQVFRVPLLDPAAQQSSTGGYPWFIEGTSATVVYVKNVTDKPQEYVLELSYAGGSYTLGLKQLAAGQTAVVDIRNLRDNQVADENGQVMPMDAAGGQVHWSSRGPQDLVLIGRAEQVDVLKGVSSSYACQNCCGDSFDHGSCLPSTVIGVPSDTSQFSAQEYDHNCYGVVGTPFSVSPSQWSSDNTAVATVNSSGLATAQGGGSTNIVARWTAYVRHLTGFPAYCITETILPGASALCQVQVPTSLGMTIDPLRTHSGSALTDCADNTIVSVAYGYSRLITYTVLDQNGNAIMRGGMTATEDVTKVSSNPANINGDFFLSGVAINSDGQFCDVQAFINTSAPPPQQGEFLKQKMRIDVAIPGRAWTVRWNCLNKQYNDVTITATNQDATCQ